MKTITTLILAPALLLALSAPVSIDGMGDARYRLRAVAGHAGVEDLPTCGAVPRMLRDRWTARFTGGRLYLNGMEWADPTKSDGLGWSESVYRADPKAYTLMRLKYYRNDRGMLGLMTLLGRLPSRESCGDSVELEGARL